MKYGIVSHSLKQFMELLAEITLRKQERSCSTVKLSKTWLETRIELFEIKKKGKKQKKQIAEENELPSKLFDKRKVLCSFYCWKSYFHQ